MTSTLPPSSSAGEPKSNFATKSDLGTFTIPLAKYLKLVSWKVSESEVRLMEMEFDYMSEVEEGSEELFVIKILSSKYDEMKPKEVASS